MAMSIRLLRSPRAAALIAAAAALAAGAAACSRATPPSAAKSRPSIAETLMHGLTRREANGKVLYERYCLVCHGATAAGDGFNASTLTPRPTDLVQQVKSEGDDHVAETIRIGSKARGRSALCPPWGLTLDASKIEEVVLYVKTIQRPEPGAGAAGK
jgi:mono/diheme cytochrome c family protein